MLNKVLNFIAFPFNSKINKKNTIMKLKLKISVLKLKIRVLDLLSFVALLALILFYSLHVTRSLDFYKTPVSSGIIFFLAAYGAAVISSKLENIFWKKIIKPLEDKYEQSKAASINQDTGSN